MLTNSFSKLEYIAPRCILFGLAPRKVLCLSPNDGYGAYGAAGGNDSYNDAGDLE